jgi:DNA-binding NtrC family response regulator
MQARTVLVLDDNPAFVRAITATAEGLGLDVAATDDPDSFPALLDREDAVAAIVDCMLGDRSGLALLPTIGQRCPALPTLVVSGYGDAFLAQAARLGQSHGLTRLSTLAKPFRITLLQAFLSDALAPA